MCRLDHWCGQCDKCCFVDLVLAPFMDRAALATVFAGDEPLENPVNEQRFRALLELGTEVKPFECVGDTEECRSAALLAAQRQDRGGSALLHRLCGELAGAAPAGGVDAAALLTPKGPHRIPDGYAPADLLVRTR
jgi:UDP-N-acetyl-alpha-D-muramoyl-L-alanyl-L-glutamate epimerase